MKRKYLLIAIDGSPQDWYTDLPVDVIGIATEHKGRKFDSPRVHVMLDSDDYNKIKQKSNIRVAVCIEPLTDEEISSHLLNLYSKKDPDADKLADLFLGLISEIKKIGNKSSET